METVEVLVRIPKRDFEELQSNYVWWGRHGEYIKKGTVLPKGHGVLKDIAEIERLWQKGDYDSIVSALLFAPAVIEADKAESEKKE